MLAGALVAGLDAGMGYNTWPLIDGAFVPTGLGEASPWYLNLFENPLTVQFDHRMLGYAVVAAALSQFLWLALKRAPPAVLGSAFTLALLAMLQMTLGVWTLLLSVPITLGLAHQAGAIVVFARGALSFVACAQRASRREAAHAACKRLIEIGDEVPTSSSPIDSRTTSGPAPARTRCLVGELAVRGRGGVNDQAPRIADIGEMAEQLDVAHERDARLVAALEPEGEHGARRRSAQ